MLLYPHMFKSTEILAKNIKRIFTAHMPKKIVIHKPYFKIALFKIGKDFKL